MRLHQLSVAPALAGCDGNLSVLSLAYWWLDNFAHELFGTTMFFRLGQQTIVGKYLARYSQRSIVIRHPITSRALPK